MKPYARDRCTNPRKYYRTAQDVLEDDVLTASEKELALKTMSSQVELLDEPSDEDMMNVGEHPPTIWAIQSALSDLGERHTFPAQEGESDPIKANVDHVVAAISGNSDVDREVCNAAKKVAEITKAHVHFVIVITHVTDPAEYGALAPVGAAAVAPHIGIRRLEDEREQRKKKFAEFAKNCALPDVYSTEVRTGLIDNEIIEAANEGDASLIIVGSGEKAWLDGILSSDVAQKVSSKAKRPVLVVPEKDNVNA